MKRKSLLGTLITSRLKRLFFATACILISVFASAQLEYSQWYFGKYAGLGFSGGCAPSSMTGPIRNYEGVASISDAAGNLLLFSNGITVWDQSLTTMPNGTGLLGGSVWQSSTQAAVIVKQPGPTNRYYIFTTGEVESSLVDGFRYSVVDMNLVGNGTGSNPYGDVDPAYKNVLINSSSTERITVCRNGNATGYWIFMHEFGNNRFNAYELTSSGLNLTPVASNVGYAITSIANFQPQGQMKVNRQESRLAMAIPGFNAVQVFDLNRTTGALSLSNTLGKSFAYSVAFSPNGNLLYSAAQNPGILTIHQWDLNLSSPPAVNIGSVVSTLSIGQMQLAPDICDKIYVARQNQTALGVINNPDVSGVGCNFDENGPVLASSSSSYLGLPQVHRSEIFTCDVTAGFDFNETDCGFQFINLSQSNLPTDIVSYHWTFGDGTSSAEANPKHFYLARHNAWEHYEVPGVYEICLTVTGFDGEQCCTDQYCTEVTIDCEPLPCSMTVDFTQSQEFYACGYLFEGDIVQTNRDITTWIWDFGDGSVGTGKTINHSFLNPGSYTVCLTVMGDNGDEGCCTQQICKVISITC